MTSSPASVCRSTAAALSTPRSEKPPRFGGSRTPRRRYGQRARWCSVDDDTDDLDADSERVELVAATLAEMVVVIAAAFVVEPDPEPFPVLGQFYFEAPASP